MWKFIKGYVIITIRGFNINKCLDKALNSGLNIYDLKKDVNNRYYSGYIHLSQLNNLLYIAKKTNCNIETKSFNLQSMFYRYIRIKLVFVLSIFLYLLLIYFISSLVWIIDIDGNLEISKESILQSCKELGLYTGADIKNIDCKMISENLKEKYPNITWINVSNKGTRIYIKLNEGIENKKYINDSKPSNIIACENGIISHIITNSGTPFVKKDDVVKKGDILISGKLVKSGNEEIEINDTVHSNGIVKAYVTREFSTTTPLKNTSKIYTGKESSKYRVKLWNLLIGDHSSPDFKLFDVVKTTNQLKLKDDINLPVVLYTYKYREYINKENIINEDEAKRLCEKKLMNHIIDNYSIGTDIISCKTNFISDNNNVTVNAVIVSEENIGEEQEITYLGGNIDNESTETTNTQ